MFLLLFKSRLFYGCRLFPRPATLRHGAVLQHPWPETLLSVLTHSSSSLFPLVPLNSCRTQGSGKPQAVWVTKWDGAEHQPFSCSGLGRLCASGWWQAMQLLQACLWIPQAAELSFQGYLGVFLRTDFWGPRSLEITIRQLMCMEWYRCRYYWKTVVVSMPAKVGASAKAPSLPPSPSSLPPSLPSSLPPLPPFLPFCIHSSNRNLQNLLCDY